MSATARAKQLLDEPHLWIHPVLAGKGTSLFAAGRYGTVATRTFDSGVVTLEPSDPQTT